MFYPVDGISEVKFIIGDQGRGDMDEAAALDSSGDDAEDRIAVAIRSKAIYTARVTSREATQARLLPELKTAKKGLF
jgi:hypothetical protein